ncbi:type II secretion system F family protein [Caballeronia sp. LjRoot34]|uniref:type II secretion system F family protein n=1 Tax=Caballeronia sp. LjRoot34 TaxID=3342325 RepID=UPI003ECD981A
MSAGLSWRMRRQLYEQASSQIENGRTLTEVLVDFRDRLQRRGRAKAAASAHDIYRKVRDGKTLMGAMAGSLTDLEYAVLGSGEKAGQLPQAMQLVLETRERMARIQRRLLASLFAPAVYLVTLYVVLFFIGAFVVPQFATVLPRERWTGWAYALYVMGQVAAGWFAPMGIALLGAVIAAVIGSLPRWTGEAGIAGRRRLDAHVFPYTVYREVTGFAWLLSFVTLLRAGVTDSEALAGQIRTASPWLASRLRPVVAGLRNGLDMAAAMRLSGYGFPSADLIDEIGAYVGFADFPRKIEQVARGYADVLERRLMVRAMVVSAAFSALMFLSFVVLQLGANSISSILASSMGAF